MDNQPAPIQVIDSPQEEVVNTIYGYMPVSALEKRQGVDENDAERVSWTEYHKDGELVHRSVHITLKSFP